MIKINGNDYPVKVSEMTLEQWANVSNAIQVFKDDALLQFEAVLKSIGVPEKECDLVPISFMKELYEQMDDDGNEFELIELFLNRWFEFKKCTNILFLLLLTHFDDLIF